jgi:hypothetical protein
MAHLQKQIGRFPIGVWLAAAALALLMLAWCMQAYSLLNWDHAVDLGIQNERFSEDPAEAAWALESWGIAVADLMWPMPLTVVALAGVLRRRFIGFAAGLMACAIGVYFPLFFAFQRWHTFPGVVILALVMFLVPCLVATVGLWSNRSWFPIPHAANTSSKRC